jgi:hypothetical protein
MGEKWRDGGETSVKRKAKPMKEWLVVTGGSRLWIPLAREARDFAAGTP